MPVFNINYDGLQASISTMENLNQITGRVVLSRPGSETIVLAEFGPEKGLVETNPPDYIEINKEVYGLLTRTMIQFVNLINNIQTQKG